MSETPAAAASPLGLVARFMGVIFSPGATFKAALQTPKPVGILLVVALIVGLAAGAPQMTESGRQAVLDAQVEAMERSGQEISDQAYAAMQSFNRFGAILAVVGTLIVLPVTALIVTGFLWGVFNALLGGTATFKQVLTVVTHGMVIAALGTLAAMPVFLMQGTVSTTSPFNLGLLAPMLDDTGFPARFLRAVNVFGIWQTIVVAIGMAVLYRKAVRSVAMGLLVVYALVTAVFVTVFGSFMNFGG